MMASKGADLSSKVHTFAFMPLVSNLETCINPIVSFKAKSGNVSDDEKLVDL
jgi:hypothetical protein